MPLTITTTHSDVLAKSQVINLGRIISWGLLVIIWPLLFKNQLITGTLVNASLILVGLNLGWRAAQLMSFMPSMVALATGLLPLAALPAIPIIISGNLIYLAVVSRGQSALKLSRQLVGWAILATMAKVGWLGLISHWGLASQTGGWVNIVLKMLSWPQILTALGGVFLAVASQQGWLKIKKQRD